jgi:membrane protein
MVSAPGGSDHLSDPKGEPKSGIAERVTHLRASVEHARGHNPALISVMEAAQQDAQTGGGLLGAAVAFRTFLFLVPYAFVIVTALGFSDTVVDRPAGEMAKDIGIGGLMFHAVAGSTSLSRANRLVALFGGLFALLLASRALLRALRATHALIWRVPLPPAKSALRPVLALLGVVTAGLLLSIGINEARTVTLIGGLAATLATIAIPAAVWLLVSMRLPHAPAPWWAFLPGAVLAAIGIQILNLFTVYWLPVQIAHKSATYGAIAIALALLGWAYLLGRVLTASAVLNAYLWYRSQHLATFHPAVAEAPRSPPEASLYDESDPQNTIRITPSG